MMVLPYGVIGNTTDFGSVIIGSSPIGVTKGVVVQLVRIPALQAGGAVSSTASSTNAVRIGSLTEIRVKATRWVRLPLTKKVTVKVAVIWRFGRVV